MSFSAQLSLDAIITTPSMPGRGEKREGRVVVKNIPGNKHKHTHTHTHSHTHDVEKEPLVSDALSFLKVVGVAANTVNSAVAKSTEWECVTVLQPVALGSYE